MTQIYMYLKDENLEIYKKKFTKNNQIKSTICTIISYSVS
jgi:hypothetical protein